MIRGWRALEQEVLQGRCQIWRNIRAGKFPAPVQLGPNSVGWWRAEIEAFKAALPRRTYGTHNAAATEGRDET